jgi:MFS family permease
MATLIHPEATIGAEVDEGPPPRLGAAIGPLLLVSFVISVGFTMLQSFGIMAESAKAELQLSDHALAMVQGVSAAISLVLFSIPIGIWVDRRSRVRILLLMAVTWTAATLLTAAASNVATLFFARMFVGIGATGALTAVLSLASDYCRPDQRGRALLVPNLTKAAGVGAGFTIAGFLLQHFATSGVAGLFGASPWRSTQWALGIGSALLLLPILLLREPPRHEVEAGPGAPLGVLFAELWARRAWVIPLFVGQVTVVMADAAAAIWAAPLLQRSYHQQPGDFAGWLGAIVFLTGILGSIAGGIAADAGQKSRLRGGLMAGAIVASVVGVPCALFPLMPSVAGFATAIGLLMLVGNVTGIVASVALTVWLPNELRGLAIGAFIAVAGLIGFGVAPSLVAGLSAFLGGEAHLATAQAMVGVAVSIVSVIGFGLAMRNAPAAAIAPPIG